MEEARKPPRTLVIDDSLTARVHTEEVLKSEGIEVLTAASAGEGTEFARAERPDVILLDVVLPDKDGITLCQEWRRDPVLSEIPVLLVSGERSGKDDRVAGLRAGAMGYIVKPFNQSEMLAQVNLLYELGQTHRRLKEQALIAETANRTKDQFLANMSHEIRTPLTAIIGFAEQLVASTPNADQLDETARIIVKNGKHLLQLLNDILDLSKIEAGKLDIERIPCSPAHIVESVATIMRFKAEEKGLELRIEYAGPLPEQIETDPTRTKQILFNLLSNAIKFTSKGVITLRVQYLEAEEQISFEISDTGIGLSEAQQSQLFQAFVQGDHTFARRFGGTGLGLVISKHLAERLGGTISFSSAENRGTTFRAVLATGTITAPLAMPSKQSPRTDERPLAAIVPLAGQVLVAEDAPDNRKLLQLILKRVGVNGVFVENGEIAVGRASNEHFDLILMDMEMPVMDGYTAAGTLRAQGYDGPIVAITAHAMKAHIDQCFAAGCNAYVHKPFDLHEFYAVLAKYLPKAAPQPQANPKNVARAVKLETAPDDNLQDQDIVEFEDDPRFVEMIEEFFQTFPAREARLHELLSKESWQDLKLEAHRLRGAAGLLGLIETCRAAAELETKSDCHSAKPIADSIKKVHSVLQENEAQYRKSGKHPGTNPRRLS